VKKPQYIQYLHKLKVTPRSNNSMANDVLTGKSEVSVKTKCSPEQKSEVSVETKCSPEQNRDVSYGSPISASPPKFNLKNICSTFKSLPAANQENINLSESSPITIYTQQNKLKHPRAQSFTEQDNCRPSTSYAYKVMTEKKSKISTSPPTCTSQKLTPKDTQVNASGVPAGKDTSASAEVSSSSVDPGCPIPFSTYLPKYYRCENPMLNELVIDYEAHKASCSQPDHLCSQKPDDQFDIQDFKTENCKNAWMQHKEEVYRKWQESAEGRFEQRFNDEVLESIISAKKIAKHEEVEPKTANGIKKDSIMKQKIGSEEDVDKDLKQ